jgi:hypothetical protein
LAAAIQADGARLAAERLLDAIGRR